MAEPDQISQIHVGHRERMRERMLRDGDESFTDQNLLELLLYYAVPKGDTAPTAAALCAAFGSLRDVLDAPMDALTEVKGIGQYSAAFLKLIPAVIRRYCDQTQSAQDAFCCTDRESVKRYLRSRFLGVTTEQMLFLAFNARGEFIRCVQIGAEQSDLHVDVHRRIFARVACQTNAVTAILSHIHPGGVAAPSSDDVLSTRTAAQTLHDLGVHLQDHVILDSTLECCFMSDIPRFQSIFF